MANTLTNLIPDAYVALDVVSRELTGFLSSVTRDATADRVAEGQTVRSFIAPKNSAAGDISPSMTAPSAADQTITNAAITIQKQRFAPFSWTGEEEYAVDQGPGFLNIRQAQIAQAIRTLVNEMEAQVYDVAAKEISRATGSAASTPFSSNFQVIADLKKILDDNGAPLTNRSLILDTVEGAALRKQTELTNVNQAGDNATLRDGELLHLLGFSVKESAQVSSVADSGATGFRVNNGSGYAAGTTELTIDSGSGTIIAGDIVTIGSHNYGVAAATSPTLTLNAPGLEETVADNDTITVIADTVRLLGFSQDAICLATRLPEAPRDGDQALGREVVTDPRSGISLELVKWPGYDMNTYHVRACFGASVISPEHVGAILS